MKSQYSITSSEIPEDIIRILEVVQPVLNQRGNRWLLIGAFSRDVLLTHIHGRSVGRTTRDVDFAIYVNSWEDYRGLEAKLLAIDGMKKLNMPHRFEFRSIPIDIIPFGDIQDKTGNILWPPDEVRGMSVLGFEEALSGALDVDLADKGFSLKVPTMAALAMLKVLSWSERENRSEATKDAKDIAFILDQYLVIDYELHLEEHADLWEKDDFDEWEVAAIIIGRKLKELLKESPQTSEKLIAILREQSGAKEDSRLAVDMGSSLYPRNLSSIRGLLLGLHD